MSLDAAPIFANLSLSRRLELAEARSNVDFVEARAQEFPESGAQWTEVGGAYAMFDGVDSPLTQSFGLGLFTSPTAAQMSALEGFFAERGAPVCHEVSPLAGVGTLAMLTERGYQPVECTSLMYLPLPHAGAAAAAFDPKIGVRVAGVAEHELWAQTAARGWSELPEMADIVLNLSRLSAARRNVVSFLAEVDGTPIATGALNICEGVALLAGASTVAEARGRGAQRALLDARLRCAVERGCDVAMMGALPGSDSQRNAERQGFRIAYTRIKWRLVPARV